MRYLAIPLLLAGCAASNIIDVNPDRLNALTADELKVTEFYVASAIEFVSLNKGEIVGEDIFKYEKKKTFVIEPDTAGHLVANGPGWLNVEFPPGIVLTFTWAPVERAYLTPGWGTITVDGERFDLKQGVLTGRMVKLLMAGPASGR